MEVTIDTLQPEEAQYVTQLVNEASFFDLPANKAAALPGADRMEYTIRIQDDGQNR